MPIFQITYTDERTEDITHEVEWVTDPQWSQDRIRECFKERFPRSSIVHIEDISDQHF
jgi:hypothetical protein